MILSLNIFSQNVVSVGMSYSSNKMIGINGIYGNTLVFALGASIHTDNFTYPDIVYQSTTFAHIGLGINILKSTAILGTFGIGISDRKLTQTGDYYYYRSSLHDPHVGVIIQQRIYRSLCLYGILNKIDGIGAGISIYIDRKK